jgi:2-polyprenyl-3-methyl-5-hydroxy-6-metoxy-1,4-benzoquinol methylase
MPKLINPLSFLKKVFFQPLRPWPTTQPIHYQLRSEWWARVVGLKPFSSFMYVIPGLRTTFTHLDVNERVLELPFVFAQTATLPKKAKILDVGCCENTVGIGLASLGYQVTGIDIRPYELKHPNFTSVVADICQPPFKKHSFDAIICLSTLEHIGLETAYRTDAQAASPQKALAAMRDLLKPGGKLILTTPVAQKHDVSSFQRLVTPTELKKELADWQIEKFDICVPDRQRTAWLPLSPNQKLPKPPKFGVALITAKPTR